MDIKINIEIFSLILAALGLLIPLIKWLWQTFIRKVAQDIKNELNNANNKNESNNSH